MTSSMYRARRGSRAFTLIELIVVIVIMGILVAIGAFAYNSVVDSSHKHSARMMAVHFSQDAGGVAAGKQQDVASLYSVDAGAFDDVAGDTDASDVSIDWGTPGGDGAITAGVSYDKYCTPVLFPAGVGSKAVLGETTMTASCKDGGGAPPTGDAASTPDSTTTTTSSSNPVFDAVHVGGAVTPLHPDDDASIPGLPFIGMDRTHYLSDNDDSTGMGPLTWDPSATSPVWVDMSLTPSVTATETAPAGWTPIAGTDYSQNPYTPQSADHVTLKVKIPTNTPQVVGAMAFVSYTGPAGSGNATCITSSFGGADTGCYAQSADGWITVTVPWSAGEKVVGVSLGLDLDPSSPQGGTITEFQVQ